MIATVTYNPAVDQTVAVDGPLDPDAVTRATDARFDAGGKGINVSQVLAALDHDTLATGLLGGFTGTYVREECDAAEVSSAFVDVEGTTRLNTTVLADQRYKINAAGPEVGPPVVDGILDRLYDADPDWVLVGGSLPPGLDEAAVDAISHEGSWRTAVDVDGDLFDSLEGNYDLWAPNRLELAAAAGRSVDTVDEAIAAAETLRERGVEHVFVTLGADGAALVGPEGALVAAALDVEAVDEAGAGDAAVAGLLAAVDRGADDERALREAVALSGRVVTVAGTAPPRGVDPAAHIDRVAVDRR